MSEKSLRVLLTGGGSGGPTNPLLALAKELLNQADSDNFSCECLFLGSKHGPEKQMVQNSGIPFETIPSGKLRRYWSWKNFVDPLYILGGGLFALWFILRFRPNVVVSAGSFVSVPVAIAAWIFQIPHVILQMDVRAGLANRLMAPFSTALAYHLAGTEKSFPAIKLKRKIGVVVRDEILNSVSARANSQFQLNPNKPLVLITGGGQGATGLNQAVLPLLKEILLEFQVVHLTGKNWKNEELQHHDYQQIEIVHQGMGDLLSRSEVVITRAGMGIMGELAALKKDCILVPLPGTHQEENAVLISENAAAVMYHQKDLPNNGKACWRNFLEKRKSCQMGEKLHQLLAENGTKEFVELIFEVTEND